MNKLQERAVVEAFIQFSGIPGLRLVEWDRERPDAVIESPEGAAGIEITALSEASPRQTVATQQWRTEGARLVEATRRAFESQSQTAVIVNIAMCDDWVPSNRVVSEQLASDLAALIASTLASPPPWPRDREPCELHDPHPGVDWIYISRSSNSSHWAPSVAGRTEFASAADLAVTIARTESSVETYRQAAPTIWLLIDCNIFGQGVALDVPQERLQQRTQFDRLFCCGFAGWRWVEIPVDRSRAWGQPNLGLQPTARVKSL